MMSLKKITLPLFYLLVVFLPTQLCYRFWPKNTITQGLRLDYLSIPIYLTDVLLLMYLLAYSLSFGLKKDICMIKTFLPWIIYQLIQTFLILKYQPQNLYLLIKLVFVLLFILSMRSIKYNRLTLVKIFISQLIFLFILSMLQVFKQGSLQGIFYYFGERKFLLYFPSITHSTFLGKAILRPYAIFSHPNVLAAYVLLISIYSIFIFIHKKHTMKHFQALILIVLLPVLTFANSQNAWLAMFIALLIYNILQKYPRLKSKILAFLIGINILLPFLLKKFSGLIDLSDINRRNLLFEKILNLNFWQYLGGVGYYHLFKLKSAQFFSFESVQPPHHLIWLLLVAQGLISLFFLLKPISIFYQKIITSKNSFYLLVTVICLSSFDHYFITSQQALFLLAFLIGDCLNADINLKAKT